MELETMPMERLEAEITESAAHIAAAECRWLLLVGEFDRREGAASWGALSTAHWLNWKCGLALGAAREHVRVARRLGELPAIRSAYANGQLSYSKVRAITRAATSENEVTLVELASAMTAEHVERLVRGYRRASRSEDEATKANERHRERYLSCNWDDDGSLSIKGKLSPEDGAVVMAALRLVSDTLRHEGGDVPPEPGEQPWDGWAASQADALVAMAESVLADGPRAAKGADRYQVVIHADAEVLAGHDDQQGRCQLDGGPTVAAETLERVACDASVVHLFEGPEEQLIAAGRKTRTVSASLARALRARDQGCRFPGCTHRRFVDAHHVQPWSQGGETTLANLACLCRRHHRLVHEGGFRMLVVGPGRFEFYRPDGSVVEATVHKVDAGDRLLREANQALGISPTPDSLLPDWDGDQPDYDYILDGLLATATRGDVPAGMSTIRQPSAC